MKAGGVFGSKASKAAKAGGVGLWYVSCVAGSLIAGLPNACALGVAM